MVARRKYTISDRAIEARRNAGKSRAKQFTKEYQQAARAALAAKVDSSFWRFVGRIGGRRSYYNKIASDYQTALEAEQAVAASSLTKEFGRTRNLSKHYETQKPTVQDFYQRYDVSTGTRVMLGLFEPNSDGGKLVKMKYKRRGKLKKKTRRQSFDRHEYPEISGNNHVR